jgi:tRNA(His) 5'-end guanylyltransferase
MDRMMREREIFSTLAVPKGAHPIIRVDGIGFTKYTASAGYDKPFDLGFHSRMVETAMFLLVRLEGIYATTHSDEISIALRPGTDLYGRRAEKLASVAAGHASAKFGQAFDGRVSVANYTGEVVDYFSWRQADARSNFLSSLAYWTLRKRGMTASASTSALRGANAEEQRALLGEYGIDPDEADPWMQRGVALSWKHIEREGFNPITNESVVADRTVVEVNAAVPSGDEYRSALTDYLMREVDRG